MEPTPIQEFPLADLIACATREVGMRETCYVKWDKKTSVAELSLSRKREINMMRAIEQLLTLQAAQPSSLSELKVVAHTTEAGQQRYYKADEVEVLLARRGSQSELLASMGETNRVLAERLKMIADRLPSIAQELGDAEDLADEGNSDGYEACYNAAGNARGAIKGLLRELNPTVKGGQQGV